MDPEKSQAQKLEQSKEMFEKDGFSGLDTHHIGDILRMAGLDKETVRAFGAWFVEKGTRENWLLDELGF